LRTLHEFSKNSNQKKDLTFDVVTKSYLLFPVRITIRIILEFLENYNRKKEKEKLEENNNIWL
jgi:hypothetical protein